MATPMLIRISARRSADAFDGYSPEIVLTTPFIIGGEVATLKALAESLSKLIADSSLTSYAVVNFTGSNEDLEAARTAQQIQDDERTLTAAAEIIDRRTRAETAAPGEIPENYVRDIVTRYIYGDHP